MKILITGINGFVGKILKQSLIAKGYDVYGLDVASTEEKVYSIDITDFSAVNECIKKVSPQFIIHLAGISRTDIKNPGSLYNINVNGTINILTASVNLVEMPKVLFISSSYVYGNVDTSKQPISEQTIINPINHYGASKAASENIARAYYHEYGLPLTIVRPVNHIGRGQSLNFIVPKIINALKNNAKEIELGNIQTIRDFLDVRDVIDAYVKIVDNFPDGETFNIASGKGIMIADIIEMLQNITGIKLKILKNNDFMRKNDIMSLVCDYSKIKKKLNWQPVHSLKETLEWIWNDSK